MMMTDKSKNTIIKITNIQIKHNNKQNIKQTNYTHINNLGRYVAVGSRMEIVWFRLTSEEVAETFEVLLLVALRLD